MIHHKIRSKTPGGVNMSLLPGVDVKNLACVCARQHTCVCAGQIYLSSLVVFLFCTLCACCIYSVREIHSKTIHVIVWESFSLTNQENY